MLQYWIWLTGRKNLGCRSMRLLLQRFASVRDIYFAAEGDFAAAEGLSRAQCASLLDKDLQPARQILETCYNEGIQILTIQDAMYPEKLRVLEDAPPVLYYKGTLPAFDLFPVIGLVGTRRASGYGLLTAKRLGYQLGSGGAVVVSGLARGIDAMGMTGALTAGAPVVGVLGCGVDRIYPQENRYLFADTQANGCLISEYPPGTLPLASNFPVRNRIISGLSDGVLVVEAAERSGALITARAALEQGRDVFAVPGNVDVQTSAGTNQLIREGAILTRSGWDVLEEYTARYPEKIVPYRGGNRMTLGAQELQQAEESEPAAQPDPAKNEKNSIDNSVDSDYIDVDKLLPALPPLEAAILEHLRDQTQQLDDLIALCQQPAGQVLAAMTMLELKQYVTQLPGKRYTLAKRQK